ncbi:MAG: NYN domain-containing protein [Pseudomonadota bacterium]
MLRPNQKTGILIDAENVETSAAKVYKAKLNYKTIVERLKDRKLVKCLYYKPEYLSITKETEDYIVKIGGEIKQPQKNVDLYLAVDAVTLADKLDVYILVGGDKDYAPLVWYLKSKGCTVEIWAFPDSTANELIEVADNYVPLDESFLISENKKLDINKPRKPFRRKNIRN